LIYLILLKDYTATILVTLEGTIMKHISLSSFKHSIIVMLYCSTLISGVATAEESSIDERSLWEATVDFFDNAWNSTTHVTNEVWANTKEDSEKNWDKATEVSEDTWEATKEGSSEAWDKTKEVSEDTWEATKEGSSEAWDKTKEVSEDTWDATKEITTGAE